MTHQARVVLNRRDFLRRAGTAATAALLSGQAQGARPKRPPNVILILSDDQGAVDLRCYGSMDLHTPHLDALAARGVRFTQFYVGAPLCSPSRAALLTGRCPQRAGLETNAGDSTGLPPEQITLAEVLRERGYRAAIFGKWHLGGAPELSPNAQGFDEFLGHKNGCIDNYSHFFYWSGPNRHDLWRGGNEIYEDGAYFPRMVTREACRFLEEHWEDPFFLYLPFNIPHYPIQPLLKYRKLYEALEEPRRRYAALVSTLDEQVGEVVAKVDALGLREETIIVFLSDHGHSVEERAFFGGGNSGPCRGHKFTLWEGGIRVPCIVSQPGALPEGAVRDQVATSLDWFPTLAGYCGAAPTHRIDGADLAGVIADDSGTPHETLHWQLKEQWAAREGAWKLLVNVPPSMLDGEEAPAEPLFLANIEEDPGERRNYASEHPEMVEHLRALHDAWVRDTQANT